jgi:hypothetical protein
MTPATFQGLNYLDERSPLAPQLQASPWPNNFREGTYPKYNGSTDLAQYIMSYQVTITSSRGDDATMSKSFIIALKGPTLTWYTRLPPLSIDSWKTLHVKFLLSFQGYRPDTDALVELSLCRQHEKETLREYYKKFLLLKLQLPSVDDHIAIHYAISGLRVGVLYSHCIRDPPKNLQELYQLFEKYTRSEELHQRIPRAAGPWQKHQGQGQRSRPTTAKVLLPFHGEDSAHPPATALKPRPQRTEWPETNWLTTKELSPTPTIPNNTPSTNATMSITTPTCKTTTYTSNTKKS